MNHEKDPRVILAAAIRKELSPGGRFAPIHDREEYERQMNSLPSDQKSLVQELTKHADMCQFCSEHGMEIPPHIVSAVQSLHKLPEGNQVSEIKKINQALMEYLHDVSDDSGLRM